MRHRRERHEERREALDKSNAIRRALLDAGKSCGMCRHFRGLDVECVPLQSPPNRDHYVCDEFSETKRE